MAHYNYKYVRDLLPKDVGDKFQAKYGMEYEGGCDYDGDMWLATADFISDLQNKLDALTKELEMMENKYEAALSRITDLAE